MGVVILVHGKWMPAAVMAALARRLRRAGYRARLFGYRSFRGQVDRYIARLSHAIRDAARVSGRPVMLVGHSQGGLVIRETLARHPDLPVAAVVALGTPFGGSKAAREMAGRRGWRWLLGPAPMPGLTEGVSHWPVDVPLGVIAGTRPAGICSVLGWADQPGDGTVSVAETRIEGATDYLELPVSHTGEVFSARVAAEVVNFLRHGHFGEPGAQC